VAERKLTFLLTSSMTKGHFFRVLDIAQQLSSRGHRVLFKAKYTARPEVEAAGAELWSYEQHFDLEDFTAVAKKADKPAWMPEFMLFPLMRNLAVGKNVHLAQELEPLLRKERVDCVVYDFFDFGAAWAAERVGIPYASAGNIGTALTQDNVPLMFLETSPLKYIAQHPRLLHALGSQFISLRAARAKLGLPAYPRHSMDLVQALLSPMLHITMAHRGFAGGLPMRDNQLFAGPTSFNMPSEKTVEGPRVEPGTIVVSTTTTGNDQGWFQRVLTAIAPLKHPVLATAASAEEIPAGLGDHVRIERYIPHDTVFPEARALISHGGWGTVGRGLTYGLPMLVIPIFGDQTLNGALVERAGLGRVLPLDKATPEAIRETLSALLADEGIRTRAKATAAEIKTLKQQQIAARALEQLILQGKVNPATESSGHLAASV